MKQGHRSGKFVVESAQSRHILGELPHGEDLCQGLLAVCKRHHVHCALVQATGVVEQVKLRCYDAAASTMGQPRPLEGVMHLVHTTGSVAEQQGELDLQLSVVLSRQRDSGVEVLGGICTAARCLHCSFAIVALDDVLLERHCDAATSLPLLGEVVAPSSPSPPVVVEEVAAAAEPEPRSKLSWADAVMASVRSAAEAEERPAPTALAEDYRPVRAGDVFEHLKFGRCMVLRVDSDQEYVTVRLRNSRLVRLSLEVLNLRYLRDEEGHQVFLAAPEGT